MLEDIKEFFGMMSWILLAIIGFILLLVAIIVPLSYYDCSNKGDLYAVDTKYSVVSGCFAKTSESYVPMGLYEKSMMEITNINLVQ